VTITLSGGGGDYLVVLDGLDESRQNPATFQVSGSGCEQLSLSGRASAATGTQPILVMLDPADCPTPPPVTSACITFDEWPLDAEFGRPVGHQRNQVFYGPADAIHISVHDFIYSDGDTAFESAVVVDWNTFGSGPQLSVEVLNLGFNFAELPFAPAAVRFSFRDSGGVQNFSVNDSEVFRGDLVDAPAAIGGASWSVSGPDATVPVSGTLRGGVQRLQVGGEELDLDTVCAYAGEPIDTPAPSLEPAPP
jgi:hypothetical protein